MEIKLRRRRIEHWPPSWETETLIVTPVIGGLNCY